MKNIVFTIFLSTLVNLGFCQSDKIVSDKLTKELESISSQKRINGFSVAIANQTNVLFAKGFGYSDIEKESNYTQNTIQNIGSISKTFIGIALLKAQELGKLKLDDPISKYLSFDIVNPYFPNQPITIRQLTTHTSSIKDAASYEKYGYVLKEKVNKGVKVNGNFRSFNEMMDQHTFLKEILNKEGKWYKKKNFLKAEPGQKFKYSNIAAGLAALVLEKATQEPFNEFTRKHIFQPLNMLNTGWNFNEIDSSKHSKLYANKETELALYQLINYPDGGLITSSSELGNYLSELIAGFSGNGKILSKKSYKELFTPQLTDKNYEKRSEKVYNDEYNMGVFMGFSAKGQIGHTGGDPGIATFMFFNIQTKVGKILIVNTELDKSSIKEFINIWNILEEYENKF